MSQSGPGDGADGALPGPAARPGWVWWACAGVIGAGAALFALSRWRELAQAYHLIARVSPLGTAVAVAFETLSVLCFAAVPRWLLRTGGVRWGLGRMTAVTLAANAMAGALPGGAAFSAAWLLRHLSRRGAGRVLAVAVVVTAGVASALGLLLLLTVGALLADPARRGAFFRPVVTVLLVVLSAGPALLVLCGFGPLRRVLGRVEEAACRRFGWARRMEAELAGLAGQIREVEPRLLPWLWPVALALLNWGADAACLAAAMWALGVPVPWRGLLLAYALTQLAGSLRLTPGNLGIAEATLSTLLVAYGLPAGQAIAATFVYRVVSYWILQPVGWSCWIALTLENSGRAHRNGQRNL
ncbi:lysylphosphatidylglycerol synthase transmembrane domain-containing protein [Streptomyces sp. NPDC048663]|uniref:lysylphosphatidylglycerol synthase transmembrane domain-containing protein n=1 Tax=Streptomyces sp. NPDC048663 TaxID=3155638 RepID=UPI00344398EE